PENYCVPEMYRAQPSRFYRNRGDGTFVDVTAAAGMAREFGPALGVATADVNGDGWIDIFVANDQKENQLWVNQGDGTFRNLAPLWGVALGEAGEAKADMGVDFGDFDNDGDEDLFVTELTGQGSTLYVNDGSGLFAEQSAGTGIRHPSLPYTGFGAGWLDFDNDGWLDLLAVNGLVVESLERAASGALFPLDQRNQLLRNSGDGGFDDVSPAAGAVFRLSEVSRGTAFGDLDNDGDTDALVVNAAGPVRLLINRIGQLRHWVGLRLVGVGGRDMLGRSDGTTLWRRARADGSYASASDPRVLVGLGSAADPVDVRVIWPGGRVEEWRALPVDRYTTLTEGSGR
ncbi:MAG: CRTAC1 family protein, partial [Acidobacteria bacterium]|nr:CRTAC1 family protein [Acidobacteriota bacterium]